MSEPVVDVETTVRALLTASGLTPPQEAFDTFVRLYPSLRAMADSLYEIPEVRYEEPALIYSPVA
ncbi:hypothetical protein AYO38_08320 [bacterium SCGC AG-212-C10]|nr:hypothetical protein AYO38_08320 [bacterium SCGC AG-212-C10]